MTRKIQKRLPRTVGIYALKGIVGRLFNLRPMALRLVWETGEWDPIPGLHDEDDDWDLSPLETKTGVSSSILFSLAAGADLTTSSPSLLPVFFGPCCCAGA